ncbi:DUF3592 domain-containing protein [Streptomyces laurentii]|uniref:DUF3592 domain-containing protein n=1 Tax=Streptomyces laurentii TaxID=39478 RepID=UPI0036A90D20
MTTKTTLGITFILMFAFVFVGAMYEIWRRLGLLIRGVRTTAKIVGVETRPDTDDEPRHFPVVEFTLPDSTTITVEARTGASDSAGLRPGTSIDIVYDRRKPEVVVIDSLDPGFTSFGTLAALFVCAIAAAYAVAELALEITA